ncbi:acyl carrier protein [Sedimentitalea sp. XS_ASV28]|uniref:acyl carrier protein n=1 Tax=Sedimentitalea sp. XS_ASV28 TaxID=3241296 RepID=UPI0035140857
MTIEAKIREIITENVDGIDGSMIKADAKFFDSGLDSLDLATVLLEVQEEFDVVIAEGDEDKYDTLNSLVAYVSESQA